MEASAAPSGLQRSDIMSIIAGLLLVMLLAALDQTIVATAMPTIGQDLGDVEHLPWIVTAYLLASTAATPLYGAMSDIYGRRIMLLLSLATFLIGSVFCALAPTMILLGLARAVQGAGGGGLFALSQTILGDILKPRERAQYQIHISSVFMLSSLGGPLLGGFIAQHLHWTVIFWINLPIGAVAFSMTYRHLRLLPRRERFHRLDLIGAALLVTATTSLLLALSWGGDRQAWFSPSVLGAFAVSVVVGALFGWRMTSAAEPLIPLSLFDNKVVLCAIVAASCSMGIFIGLTIYMPIYFEGVLGLTASQSGLALLPLMAGSTCGSTLTGRVMVKMRRYKLVPLAGLAIASLCGAVLALFAARLSLVAICSMLAFISIGLGTVFSMSTIMIQNETPRHQLGTAIATSNLSRQLASALFVALCGTIVIGAGIEGHSSAGLAVLRNDPVRYAALVQSFEIVFGLVATGIAIAFFAVLAIEARPLIDTAPQGRSAPGE